jgi:putative transcriptional regulator
MHQKTSKQPPIDVGDEDFNRIMAGLEQAKAIVAGAAAPESYRLHQVQVPETVDVKAIRARTGLSQVAFAIRYGFSPGAVRDWEQNRKPPEKANRLLLTIIDRRPDVIDDMLTAQ